MSLHLTPGLKSRPVPVVCAQDKPVSLVLNKVVVVFAAEMEPATSCEVTQSAWPASGLLLRLPDELT